MDERPREPQSPTPPASRSWSHEADDDSVPPLPGAPAPAAASTPPPPLLNRPATSPAPAPPPLQRPVASSAGVPRADSPEWWKKMWGPVLAVAFLIFKFGAKLKFLFVPLLKFFPAILKTGGSMLVSVWFYAQSWGWKFAVGFVVLLLVHEWGHLLAARKLGLNVGAPVFIPFMGAFIALKDAPKDAWVEAQVGIGGPMLGTLGAGLCYAAYVVTEQPLLAALAYTGFFLNLFNLAPVGFLDGGRIVSALTPWLWVLGVAIVAAMTFHHPNPILILILVFSLPRLFSLFRAKTDAEKRYFEVTPSQRWQMAGMYFGLILLLFLGMKAAHLPAPGR